MSDQLRPKAHGRWSLHESDSGPLVYDGCSHPVDPLRTVQVGETRTCDRCGQDSEIVSAHLATQGQIAQSWAAAEGIDPGADMRHIGREIRLGLDADRRPDNFEPEDESEAKAFEVIKRYIRARYGTAQQAIEQWRLGPDWYQRPTDE